MNWLWLIARPVGRLYVDTTALRGPPLLFVGKYPTDAFPVNTQYGLETCAIRSTPSDVVASLQFPAGSGASAMK